MGTYLNDVKASIELTASGRLQGSIGGSSVNLGPCRIISINAHLTGADGEITIQDNTSAAGVIKIHLKGGSGSNETFKKMAMMAAQNITNALEGKEMVSQVKL